MTDQDRNRKKKLFQTKAVPPPLGARDTALRSYITTSRETARETERVDSVGQAWIPLMCLIFQNREAESDVHFVSTEG